MAGELTDKQVMFVQEYIVDLNATQAAIRAGYSETSASEQGYQLLQKTPVQNAIQKAMDLRSERLQITSDRVLVELAKIGFADVRSMFTDADQLKSVKNLPDDIAAAVQSIEIVTRPDGVDENGDKTVEHIHKIKLADKKSSLELLGKHLKLFADRIEHTGKDGEPLVPEAPIEEVARRIALIFGQVSNAKPAE